ncbi:hypothetical protein [Pantoea sp. CCBC3-3-1]|uniref:hypothetical protein n=1 Tax=Pantoea sp. CCBC3-3-1 TaxID=2490851 RepID=UPI0020C2558A|nr:hypothetical protein [Pantoea sp. CCBC3-3-1]
MENRIEKVEAQNDLMQQDISTLKGDISLLKKDVSILKEDVAELKKDVSLIKTDVSHLQIDMAIVKSNYATKEDIAGVERNIEGLRVELYKVISRQTYWFVSSLFVLLGAGLGLAKVLF